LTDDDIGEMQKEMDLEKKDGLGLPVGVTNDVAQQQMMSQIPQQPGNPVDQEHEAKMATQQANAQEKKATKEEISNTLLKLKRIL
jgi:hypothetical protein